MKPDFESRGSKIELLAQLHDRRVFHRCRIDWFNRLTCFRGGLRGKRQRPGSQYGR